MAETENPNAGQAPLRRSFHAVWETAALELIRELSGDAGWSAAPEPVEPPPPQAVEVAAHWELRGALAGKLQIKLHRGAARAWARLAAPAGAGNAAAGLDPAEMEVLGEVLNRLAAAVTEGLRSGGWGEVEIQIRHLGPLRRTVEAGGGEFPLRFRRGEEAGLEMDLTLDAALREQIRPGARFEVDAAERGPAPGADRLDLLMDVELEVTLRFGGRQMLLHDVLELAPGSVLELDRHIDDPVELLVGGKIIAWGEVVVVDGNYGLRITRLVHKRERMAALQGGR